MDNNLLISKILKLKRELRIKINKEIVGLEFYDALLLEVRSQKQSLSNSPNLVEIASVLAAAFSAFFVALTLYNSEDNAILTEGFKIGIYFYGMLVLLIIAWLLYRQSLLLRKIKKLAILEYYLERYTDIKNESRKKTKNYPNMQDSYENYLTKKYFT